MVRFSVNSVCDYCGIKRGDLSTSGFKEHYKSHLGLDFKCDAINCKKSFPTKKRLYSHRKNVHDPNLCCELCKDLFTNKQSLNRHRKNIYLKEVMAYLCETCDKQFTVKANFERHVKSCWNVCPPEESLNMNASQKNI